MQASSHGEDRATHVRTFSVGGFRLTERAYAPGFAREPHAHATTTLSVALAGNFEEHIHGRTLRCREGQVVWRAGRECHANRVGSEGARVLLAEPDDGMQRGAHRRIDGFGLAASPHMARLVRSLEAELSRIDVWSTVAVEAILLQILAAVGRSTERAVASEDWIDALRAAIDATFREPVSLALLARRFDVHPVSLTRAFRRRFQLTPLAYVRRRRIDWCRRLLLDTDRALSAVAVDAGFYDQSHFSRAFRREMGCSPATFRAKRLQP